MRTCCLLQISDAPSMLGAGSTAWTASGSTTPSVPARPVQAGDAQQQLAAMGAQHSVNESQQWPPPLLGRDAGLALEQAAAMGGEAGVPQLLDLHRQQAAHAMQVITQQGNEKYLLLNAGHVVLVTQQCFVATAAGVRCSLTL